MEKRIILVAKVISALFSPFYAPMWAFLWLLFFSYLKLLPMGYKLLILGIVFTFTIFIPRLSIGIFRRMNQWTHWQLSHREHRHMPYALSLLSYLACLLLFIQMNTAVFFRGVIMAALAAQVICMIVNVWWKISTHMVGIGGLLGMLLAFSLLFSYNPLLPTCITLLISGFLGTSRMILRQHSLAQTLAGFLVGFACSWLCLVVFWV